MADLSALVPELFLVAAALVLLLAAVYARGWSMRAITWAAVGIMLVTFLLVLEIDTSTSQVAMHGMFRIDRFTSFMKAVVLLGAMATLILSLDHATSQGIARFEYPVLTLFAALGMLMMVSAYDLIALYLGLELQNLSLYVLASFRRDSQRSTEAGLKYFVLGALSSGMLLYGASLVYGFAGTTNFASIAQGFQAGGEPSIGVIIGLVFVIAGLAFKVAAVPFHMWTPDVYEGAPTPVTAFFAVAPNVAAIALFVRVMIGPFGHLDGQWQQVLVFISIASMVFGSFAAINQSNIKRLLAYSGIANIGFALVGLASDSKAGISGVLIYMAIYVPMTFGCFACVLAMRTKGKSLEAISDLAGLSRTHPLIALGLAIFMFSMAGIPPLAGFFSKLYIFLAAVEAKLYLLAVVGVLSSVVGAFYYLRIIKVMYFDDPVGRFDPVGRDIAVVTGVSGLFTVLFFVSPSPLIAAATAAAEALFKG